MNIKRPKSTAFAPTSMTVIQPCNHLFKDFADFAPAEFRCERPKGHYGRHRGYYLGMDLHPRPVEWEAEVIPRTDS